MPTGLAHIEVDVWVILCANALNLRRQWRLSVWLLNFNGSVSGINQPTQPSFFDITAYRLLYGSDARLSTQPFGTLPLLTE